MFVIETFFMQLKLFVFTIFLSVFWGEAQELQIKGSVKDSNNNSIAFANVVITSSSKTNFTEGTTTDEYGHFKFNQLVSGIYSLEISYLGYKTENVSLELKKDTTLQTIILEEDPQQLEGVTVIARRPTVKRLVDRLVFNVENSTLSNNNVLDVLKHTPGVIVSDGKITVKHSTPVIYINDKRIHLSINEVQQLLEGTTATNLKSVEVITNPPAKYDAEGGAVINIITSKNIISGYNGSVFGNYKQGSEFPKYFFGTSHFLKTKKLNTYINYNISPKKEYREIEEYVNFFDNNNQVISSWYNDENKVQEYRNHNINANIDYEFNDSNILSFSTNILVSPRENSKTVVKSVTEVLDAFKNLDSIFETSNNSVLETFNFAFSLDYVHQFKKKGEKLSINIHHTNFDSSKFQDVNTIYSFSKNGSPFRENKFQTFTDQIIKLNTGQLDYILPINSTTEFEAGIKVSHIDSNNEITQYIFIDEQREEDLLNSDNFLYDEVNYAAYNSYSKDWKDWSLKTGLRLEYTSSKGNSLSKNKVNKNDYLSFFPSFYLLKKIKDKDEVYIKYNRRIYRPRYSQLNPFKFFYSDNVYTQGDPSLKPEIDDVFTLGYALNKKFTFEAYYRSENNPALEIVFQDNENNKLIYKNTNIDNSISYGLDFSAYTNVIDKWNLYVFSSLFYDDNNFFVLGSPNSLYSNSQWAFYGNMINYFTFMEDRSLEINLSLIYQSKTADAASLNSDRFGVDFDLKKMLWGNRAYISVGIKDIFNKLNYSQITKYLNQDIFLKSNQENRLFVFGFNYKFGNFNLKESKKEIDIDERDRLGN